MVLHLFSVSQKAPIPISRGLSLARNAFDLAVWLKGVYTGCVSRSARPWILIVIGAALASSPASAQQAPQERVSFTEFLAGVRSEALSRGIRQDIVDAALNIEEPLPLVLERDRTQAETVL